MTDANQIQFNGQRAASAHLSVPQRGVWLCDLRFDQTAALPELGGACEVVLGSEGNATTLVGTLVRGGTYLVKSHARVIGGGGWLRRLKPLGQHNDALVTLRSVLSEAVAAAGETANEYPAGSVGVDQVDWLRADGSPRSVLDFLTPDWYVDYAGVTHFSRLPSDLSVSAELLEFDPLLNSILFKIDSVRDLEVGALVAQRLDPPMRVRSFDVYAEPAGLRGAAWLTAA